MEVLCFGTFGRMVQNVLQPPNGNLDVVEKLIGWIATRCGVDISAPVAANYLNCKQELHKDIIGECSSIRILPDTIEHIKSAIIPFLNDFAAVDLYASLRHLISEDDSIPPEKKRQLLDLENENDKSEFLAQTMLYAISKSNRPQFKNLSTDEAILLHEANMECPICHKPLVRYSKKQPLKKNFEIVYIFPASIPEGNMELKDLKSPKDKESMMNKIALCCEDAAAYKGYPTLETYQELTKAKALLAYNKEVEEFVGSVQLDESIRNVITGLMSNPDLSGYSEIPGEALYLKQKISNPLLLDEINNKVLRYYHYIKDVFHNMSTENTDAFENISTEIHLAYLQLKKTNLSQIEIVAKLSEWICKQSNSDNSSMLACNIIVAFFIQNCEVFDAITQ